MSRQRVEFKKGDEIEGFRVLAELGRGAASIIYLVQDPKTKQIWALKHVQKIDPKDGRFLDQAISEYEIARTLDHAAIRRIEKCIKKGTLLRTNELYLLMELVDGIALDKAPPQTFEQAVAVFEQVALALHHMHEKGWVHADMKPNNIVICADGMAKIIDLGQSCKIDTVKERIQGTPDYIAPEQVHRRPITPKTDIYNLGATMYWLLTRTKVPTALASADSLVSKLDDDLIEKAKPASEINKRIHPKLNELIMQCVEVDSDNRPASMKVVADRLNLILGILRAASKKRSFEPEDSTPSGA